MTRGLAAFWELVDAVAAASDGSADVIEAALRQCLEPMRAEDIEQYYRHFVSSVWKLHRWDVWEAANIVMGPDQQLSDDGFLCFRNCLVFQGRTLFEAVARSPDRGLSHYMICTGLNGIEPADRCAWFEGEQIEHAFRDVYATKTGTSLCVEFEFPRRPKGTACRSEREAARKFRHLRAAIKLG